jgi:hypothetical protein
VPRGIERRVAEAPDQVMLQHPEHFVADLAVVGIGTSSFSLICCRRAALHGELMQRECL